MIHIKDLRRNYDGSPGDHLVVQIGDETEIIIDTAPENRDIRITDGEHIYKITLDQYYDVQNILEDDVPLSTM